MIRDSEILRIIGRQRPIFEEDFSDHQHEISDIVKNSSILVIGGGGSIGQAVTKQLFSLFPKKLHIVDISENNLVELVRDIRSTMGYIDGEFKTFVLDFTTELFQLFLKAETYDYVFNLAALKHVRSEKDPFTLFNLINVNVLKTVNLYKTLAGSMTKKYFVVSSDKASAPANLMGASKFLMEEFLRSASYETTFSSARFANVAFSRGSLLDGFTQRVAKQQPVTAPNDVRRYFVTSGEAGRLCLLSAFLGNHKNIFYPSVESELHLVKFPDLALNFLRALGKKYVICETEEEARTRSSELYLKNTVPVYFFKSDTTGEKSQEEFVQAYDEVNTKIYKEVGVILPTNSEKSDRFNDFQISLDKILRKENFSKVDIVDVFHSFIKDFNHEEKNRYLDEKM